ncbi:MFS monocarboxylate transporter [Cladophialophora carrionii]|uniref:MFS monocarboxylate transporter n=1 Tax=Cladophialophora carrionii TaxID=86049 RepID=A0A1C1CG15_9EURO|nr:MFS monocarboxylate transporter [Cladophialophora carrionii]
MTDLIGMERLEGSEIAQIDELNLKPDADPELSGDVRSKNLSHARSNDSVDAGPAPDGGLRAWSIACAAHLIIFNAWGFVNSYGLFQTYYVQVMKIGGESSVAWIGTTQVFVLFGMGTWTGRALDAGFFRSQYIVGSIISVTGLFLLSLCKSFWQIFLAQTLCVGFGYGLSFVPTLALVSTYFDQKRSTALAVAVTGSCTGGLVFPAIAETMLPRVGFPWAMRTIAFVQLACVIAAGLVLKPRLPPRRSGPIVEWSAFKEAPYTLYLIGSFLYFWSVYVGWFIKIWRGPHEELRPSLSFSWVGPPAARSTIYLTHEAGGPVRRFIGTFARNALGATQATSINLLMVLNGVGVVGRMLPAYVAQRWVGGLNLMIPLAIVASIILYCWIAVDSMSGLWVFAVTYGIVAHGLQSLFPIVLANLTKDPSKAGVRSGMGFTIVGLAVLTGSPIAGALIETNGGRFIGLQLFSATTMVAAAAVLLLVRWVAVGWTREKL